MERYSFEKAQREANEMQKIIKEGKAKNYTESAKIIESTPMATGEDEWDIFDNLLDITLNKIKKIVMPFELKQKLIDFIENAEDLEDLQKKIIEIQYKIDFHKKNKHKNFQEQMNNILLQKMIMKIKQLNFLIQ